MLMGPSGRPARNCSITGTVEETMSSLGPNPTSLVRNKSPRWCAVLFTDSMLWLMMKNVAPVSSWTVLIRSSR